MSDTLVRLCGLWENTSRAGQTYLTGKLNRAVRLVAFKNNRKEKETDPDFVLFLRQDDDTKERKQANDMAMPST